MSGYYDKTGIWRKLGRIVYKNEDGEPSPQSEKASA